MRKFFTYPLFQTASPHGHQDLDSEEDQHQSSLECSEYTREGFESESESNKISLGEEDKGSDCDYCKKANKNYEVCAQNNYSPNIEDNRACKKKKSQSVVENLDQLVGLRL